MDNVAQSTIRPEVNNVITEIKSLIGTIDSFKNNFDDAHYQMFTNTYDSFVMSLDKIASLTGLNSDERKSLLDLLTNEALTAAKTLEEYLQGRKNFLKVDYDIEMATTATQSYRNAAQNVSQEPASFSDFLANEGEQENTQSFDNITSAPDKAEANINAQSNDNTNSLGGESLGMTRTLAKPGVPKKNPFALPAN
jgi:hypothetical protein